MYYRSDKLRQVICLLGVMLTLSPALQGVHAFCQLSGCVSDGGLETVAEHECSSHGCSHSHSDHASVPNPTHDDCDDNLSGSRHSSCPCPSTCWCHQTAEPLELPRSAPVTPELLMELGVYLNSTSLDTSRDEHQSRNAALASLESSAMSATELCVRLCRFLA